MSALTTAGLVTVLAPEVTAKNVIIMVADGAGFNTWIATSMCLDRLGKQVYDGQDWVQLACCTHPLNRSGTPTGDSRQDPAVVYDPAKAWAKSLVSADKGRKVPAGYKYLLDTYTDSAAAATAIGTGQKTYNSAINWTNTNEPMAGQTIAELAKAQGKAVGIVTSVQWTHATPACFGGAHNVNRDAYAEMAREMLAAPYLDVIMGAGHPEFDDNGRRRSDALEDEDYQYVGGRPVWQQLVAGAHPAGWKLIQTKEEFEALAEGKAIRKVLGTAQVATTLQQKRDAAPAGRSRGSTHPEQLFQQRLNSHVPSLATMTQAALNCLDDNPQGLFLMVEGGAVDWANHSGQPNRMIEEHIDFLLAVNAVGQWVTAHSSWEETLLILTADHECGLVWGPKSDTVPFDPVVAKGKRRIPGMKHNSGGHSNSLVPLYARGKGSELFRDQVVGTDKKAAEAWGFSGQYVDNTSIFEVMKARLASADSPRAQEAARADDSLAR